MVGMVVAVGVLSAVMYGVTSMIKNSLGAQKQVEFRQARESVRLHTIGILSERLACTATFGTLGGATGVNPTAGANQFSQIRSGPGAVQFQVGQNYESGQIGIVSMSFPTNLPTSPPHTYRQFNAGIAKGSAEFIVGIRNNFNIGGIDDGFFTVKLIVELNGANQIQSCIAVGNDADDIWKLSAVSEVYYNGGDVGIGTSNPNYTLEVVGNIHSSGTISASSRINAPSILAGTGGVANGLVTAGTIQAQKFLYTSDESLKMNIKLSSGLALVRHLRGVHFNWKKSGEPSYGVIAQEVEKIVPSAVKIDPASGLRYVDYAQLIAPLIESAKEIDDDIKSLDERLNKIESRRR